MNLDVTWMDLSSKLPYLQGFFLSEYASYLNTMGTVLLGWLIVSTITQFVRLLITHLTASAIAIILLCPTTIKWLSEWLGLDFEIILNNIREISTNTKISSLKEATMKWKTTNINLVTFVLIVSDVRSMQEFAEVVSLVKTKIN